MFKKKLSNAILAAAILAAPSLGSAQAIEALQSLTADAGLNSSPQFNILPGNPFLIGYSLILGGPQETIVISDLLQGNLIINDVLSGLPGGGVISDIVNTGDIIKPSSTDTPLEGLIHSQL